MTDNKIQKEKVLEGFVKNEGKESFFRVQRTLVPNGKLTFEQAFLVLGKKSGTKKDAGFVRWLKANVFPEAEWVFYKAEGIPFFSLEKQEQLSESAAPVDESPAKGAGIAMKRKSKKTLDTEITPSAIVEAEYARAQDLIEKCRDKNVLRKAMNIANHLAHKEEHRRHLLRRLEQV